MSNIVLNLTSEQQKLVHDYYSKKKVERNAPGVIFAAKTSNASITSYKSGKVMFQGANAEIEASKFGAVNAQKASIKQKTKGDTLPDNFEHMAVIGSDETGTGDYFGPVTVAAVYIPAHQISLVKELGVKDSKQLTDDIIRKIAPDLKKACIHSVLTCNNEKYNQIQSKGYSQGKIKALLHNQALKHVLNKMAPEKPEYILIDQFAERGVYYNYLKTEPTVIKENVLFSTKAENLHVAVATASILARYAFLKAMDQLALTIGFPIQKGAGNKVDEMAARIWLKHGEETLKNMTKWHFANTEKAKKLIAKKRS